MPHNDRTTRQIRSVPVKFTTRSGENGPVIAGYFAVFDSPYEMWPGCIEKIAPGAFASSMGRDVRALVDHVCQAVQAIHEEDMQDPDRFPFQP